MKIRTKLTLLLFAIILLVAVAITMQRKYEVKRLWSLFNAGRTEKELVFDKIISLKDAQLQSCVSDYSFWDEMISFVSSSDKSWAAANIDTSLATYGMNAIWVYGPDLSPAYSVDNTNGTLKDIILSPQAIKYLFAQGRYCRFFIDTKQGPVEVRGATIHPTSDPERKAPPRGYLFAAYYWDDKFLKELSQLTETSIRFASPNEKEAPASAASMTKGESEFLRDLKGWDGRTVAKIAVLFRSESIKHYNETGQTVFFTFLFFSAGILLVILFAAIRWVTSPLKAVSSSLGSRDPAYVAAIRDRNDEFGNISRLIFEFFEQSDALKSETSQRRRAELQEKAILDNIPDIAWLKDKESRFIAVNEPFAKSCGVKASELIKKNDYDVWPKELAEKYIADDKEVMLSGQRKVLTEPLFSADGGMLWIETIKTPIYNDKGEVIGTTGIARDVTERRKAEEELKKAYVELKEAQHRLMQAEKYAALGKFSSSFAHEIKNPLGIILNGVEFLEMRLKETEPDIREDLDIIKRSTLRADGIIQRLLKFARPTEVKLEKMKPEDLVNDTLSFFKYSAPAGEIKISTDFSKEDMTVMVDKNQMQQAMVNLVLNAAEAMPRGGNIIIKTYKVEQSEFYFAKPACVIEIDDNGCGIPEENLSKVFEPFFTTKSEKGTGLGLFITKIIIDNNKGNMVVESKLGKGTSIKINLPLA